MQYTQKFAVLGTICSCCFILLIQEICPTQQEFEQNLRDLVTISSEIEFKDEIAQNTL
jgi:hypothetical protein